MVKNKHKEYIVSNYILQDTSLLFEKFISDITVKEKGKVVELTLYYSPNSKYDVWKIKKKCLKEPQYITSFMKNGMLCAKFYAPSKYTDLIVCKMNTLDNNLGKIYNFEFCETKNPGRS